MIGDFVKGVIRFFFKTILWSFIAGILAILIVFAFVYKGCDNDYSSQYEYQYDEFNGSEYERNTHTAPMPQAASPVISVKRLRKEYAIIKGKAVGEYCKCPICGNYFYKKYPLLGCCSNECDKRYWEIVW